MNAKERELINLMQNGIPLVSRPYKVLGEALNLSEEGTLTLFKGLKEKGFIRRFGGIVNITEVGIVSTLVGLKVDPKAIDKVAFKVNELSGVTHNYQRDDSYNLWFTLMAADHATLNKHIQSIRAIDDVESLINLPSVKKYKTKVVLEL